MEHVIYQLIKNGMKTMEDVPEHLKVKVQALLDKDNV